MTLFADLQMLIDAVSDLVKEEQSAIQAARPKELLRFRSLLIEALITLSRIQAMHPSELAATDWRDLSGVEAARRVVWLKQKPLHTGEIFPELVARGWKSSSTKHPTEALRGSLSWARHHFLKDLDNRWMLTPQGELLERARSILDPGAGHREMQNLLRQLTLRSR